MSEKKSRVLRRSKHILRNLGPLSQVIIDCKNTKETEFNIGEL